MMFRNFLQKLQQWDQTIYTKVLYLAKAHNIHKEYWQEIKDTTLLSFDFHNPTSTYFHENLSYVLFLHHKNTKRILKEAV